MEYFKLSLEYFKVLLSTQMVTGVILLVFMLLFKSDIKALILRIAKIRLPGGGEISTPQLEKQVKENILDKPIVLPKDTDDKNIPDTLNKSELETIKTLLNAEKSRAYLWEYQYLNYYFVNGTQRVLDWLVSLENKTSLSLFDTSWLPIIPSPSERGAIISALENHYLIIIENDIITVSPKGYEYQYWRGKSDG